MMMNITEKKTICFHSVKDLARQLFKHHQVKVSLIINLSIFYAMIMLFLPWLENYVWNPFWTLVPLWIVVTLDLLSAIVSNWKEEKFKTQKALRAFFVIIIYTVSLALISIGGKVVEAFGADAIVSPKAFIFLARGAYAYLFLINVLSVMKHFERIGILPPFFVRLITRFIDIHKTKMMSTVDELNNEKKESNE